MELSLGTSLRLHIDYTSQIQNQFLIRVHIMPYFPHQYHNQYIGLQLLFFFNLWDIILDLTGFCWIFLSTFPSQCWAYGRLSTNICRMKDYNTFIHTDKLHKVHVSLELTCGSQRQTFLLLRRDFIFLPVHQTVFIMRTAPLVLQRGERRLGIYNG